MLTNFLAEYMVREEVQAYLELNVANYPASTHAKERLASFLKKENEK